MKEKHDTYWKTEAAMIEGNPMLLLERGEKVPTPPALWVQGRPDIVHDYHDDDSSFPGNEPERFVSNYRKADGDIDIVYVPNDARSTRSPRSSTSTWDSAPQSPPLPSPHEWGRVWAGAKSLGKPVGRSTLEQRFSAAALPELRSDLDTDTGDFGLELGDIGFELLYPHQRQILWLRRLPARLEFRFIHALLPLPSSPDGVGDYI